MSSQEIGLDSPTSSAPSPNPTPNQQEITPSVHITTLNEIDTSISTLLSSASTAVQILSGSSSQSDLASLKTSFEAAAHSYFSTLSSIEVRLRRQVYALEEAGLVPPGTERDTRRGRNLANNEDGVGVGALNRRAGGGPLDPSWLNARVDQGVEEGKKRDLLKEGKSFVQEMRDPNAENGASNG